MSKTPFDVKGQRGAIALWEKGERSLMSQKKASLLELGPLWGEAISYFLGNWGQSAVALGVLPRLSPAAFGGMVEVMEQNGHDLFEFEVDGLLLSDLYSWLEWTIPQIWGPAEDLGRLALILHCDDAQDFVLEHARRVALALRFPFPLLLRHEPGGDWRRWARRHEGLLGESCELVGVERAEEGGERVSL